MTLTDSPSNIYLYQPSDSALSSAVIASDFRHLSGSEIRSICCRLIVVFILVLTAIASAADNRVLSHDFPHDIQQQNVLV